jgi:hypothetical protein
LRDMAHHSHLFGLSALCWQLALMDSSEDS